MRARAPPLALLTHLADKWAVKRESHPACHRQTLRKLAERRLIRWHDRACEVLDPEGLREVAAWDDPPEGQRPLI